MIKIAALFFILLLIFVVCKMIRSVFSWMFGKPRKSLAYPISFVQYDVNEALSDKEHLSAFEKYNVSTRLSRLWSGLVEFFNMCIKLLKNFVLIVVGVVLLLVSIYYLKNFKIVLSILLSGMSAYILRFTAKRVEKDARLIGRLIACAYLISALVCLLASIFWLVPKFDMLLND